MKQNKPKFNIGDKVLVTYKATIVAINYIDSRILYQLQTDSGSIVFAYEDKDRIVRE